MDNKDSFRAKRRLTSIRRTGLNDGEQENEKEKFKEYLRDEKGYIGDTLKHYLYYYEKFKGSQINKKDIHDFLVKKYRNNVARAFVKAYIRFLNNYYGYNYSSESLLPETRKKKYRKAPDYLTWNEIKAMLRYMKNKRNKMMLKLSYEGGFRASELVNLKPEDFNWAEWYEDKSDYGKVRVEKAKGGKSRIVFLTPKTMQEVDQYYQNHIKNKSVYMFPTTPKEHISIRRWEKILQILGKEVLNKRVYPHKLRHSFGYQMINKTQDLRTLQEFLGHENISTTQIYSSISFETMKGSFKKFADSLV